MATPLAWLSEIGRRIDPFRMKAIGPGKLDEIRVHKIGP